MTVSYAHRCPACGGPRVRITDSRPLATGSAPIVRRRRKCLACPHRWSTYEVPADAYHAMQDLMRQIRMWKQTVDQIVATQKLSLPDDNALDLPQDRRRREA